MEKPTLISERVIGHLARCKKCGALCSLKVENDDILNSPPCSECGGEEFIFGNVFGKKKY